MQIVLTDRLQCQCFFVFYVQMSYSLLQRNLISTWLQHQLQYGCVWLVYYRSLYRYSYIFCHYCGCMHKSFVFHSPHRIHSMVFQYLSDCISLVHWFSMIFIPYFYSLCGTVYSIYVTEIYRQLVFLWHDQKGLISPEEIINADIKVKIGWTRHVRNYRHDRYSTWTCVLYGSRFSSMCFCFLIEIKGKTTKDEMDVYHKSKYCEHESGGSSWRNTRSEFSNNYQSAEDVRVCLALPQHHRRRRWRAKKYKNKTLSCFRARFWVQIDTVQSSHPSPRNQPPTL